MLECNLGPIAKLGGDRSKRPRILFVPCDENRGYAVVSEYSTVDFYAVSLNGDVGPVNEQGTWTPSSAVVDAGACTADELRLLTHDAGGLAEHVFSRTGADLTSPLAPTRSDLQLPANCAEVRTLRGAYSGVTPHYVLECGNGGNSDLFVGPPNIQFATVPTTSPQLPYYYSFSGGIHLILTEEGHGWYGAEATQLATLRTLNVEDPVSRPTFLALANANSQGFMFVGVSTEPGATLLPAKLFAGPLPPSQVSGVFVGGTLPSSIAERHEFTTLGELGPFSPLATGPLTSAYGVVGQDKTVRLTVLDNSGDVLVWSLPVQSAHDDWQPLQSATCVNPSGRGYSVLWTEGNSNNQFAVHSRSMFCL